MPDEPSADEGIFNDRLPAQKIKLFLSHLYLLPWFFWRYLQCGLPLQPFLDANPKLRRGGLPIASKLSRYGTDPPYLPSLKIDETTDRSVVESFASCHSFPLVVKPLFGNHSRDIRRVFSAEAVMTEAAGEPIILQPYADAPKEYGINIVRIGSRVKIYGLTEIKLQSVWGDGRRSVKELVTDVYGAVVASRIDEGAWVPERGQHVSVKAAANCDERTTFRDITSEVTPELREACRDAADQIDLRFGRFDVKADSLDALKWGQFRVLEVNGSSSLDLTLYDHRHSLSVKIERLRAHWNQFFHQAEPCRSPEENSWQLLSELVWFSIAPRRYASYFGTKSTIVNSLRVPSRNGGPHVADP